MKKNLTLLLILIAACAQAQQKTILALNLKKDSTYYISSNIQVGVDNFVQGGHHTAKTVINGTTAQKVISVQDSVYNILVTYKSMSIVFGINEHQMEYGTEGDTANIISRVMRLLLNKSFSMVMSKRGEIISVEGLDKIFTDQLDNLKLTEQQKGQL